MLPTQLPTWRQFLAAQAHAILAVDAYVRAHRGRERAGVDVRSTWGVEPGLGEIDELRLADAELVHLLHLRRQFSR